jgi:hypothetical protein
LQNATEITALKHLAAIANFPPSSLSPMPLPFNPWPLAILLLCACPALGADVGTAVFDKPVSTQQWTLKELNPGLPADWTGYDFLVLEFRASSSQRFELGLQTPGKLISKRIHPYPGVWVRASIPLRFYREGLGNGTDLAATVNQPRNSYWINIESGGNGPTTDVLGLSVTMRYPQGSPKLEIRSVTLAKTDPGDDILEGGKPLIDQYGQYTHADWPGKAHSVSDLKTAWTAEAAALAAAGPFPGRDQYGGFASTQAKATGFFRVQKIDGIWWLIDPDGHYFFSSGVNGTRVLATTRATGREDYFAALPPIPRVAITSATASGFSSGSAATGGHQASFYTANVQLRFGPDFMAQWAAMTAQRLAAWGLNTAYTPALNNSLPASGRKTPYVTGLRGWQTGPMVMGMPDVYADAFPQQVAAAIQRQTAPLKDDPWLIGYFIGNEPPWPGRESQFVDLVLNGPTGEMKKHFRAQLAKVGDTPAERRALVLAAFQRYLSVIDSTLKHYDPNHLNLGIRFGGTPPDDVVTLASHFDIYTLNKYRYEPPPEEIARVHRLTGLPLLIGEFHIGVPDRGMAPGLVQAMDQHERGLAYSYYMEHAAAHPEVIGAHWFQWADEPVTGRSDGENYNIGWVDVTDQPYPELVNASRITAARLLDIHLGKIPPTDRKPKTSDIGTADEANKLGLPAIQ